MNRGQDFYPWNYLDRIIILHTSQILGKSTANDYVTPIGNPALPEIVRERVLAAEAVP